MIQNARMFLEGKLNFVNGRIFLKEVIQHLLCL